MFCTNCHKVGPGEAFGMFENVSFKSQSIQLKIDAATVIVKFDPKSIQVVQAGDAKAPEAMYDIRRGHESKLEYVENAGKLTITPN